MTNVIVDSMTFADNGDWNYSRFELIEMEDGRVLFLNVESDEYLDLDEDEYEDRWKLGEEINVGSFDYIIKEGLERGYFIETEGEYNIDSGELMFESENREILDKMSRWLGIEEIY